MTWLDSETKFKLQVANLSDQMLRMVKVAEGHEGRLQAAERKADKLDRMQIAVIGVLVGACRMALDDIQDRGGPAMVSAALSEALRLAGFPDEYESRIKTNDD